MVQGAGEGENRATVTVGLTDATGADRRELYVDARDVQPDEEKGETSRSEAYLERLMARGTNKLLEQLRTGSIELTIDAEGLSPGDVGLLHHPGAGLQGHRPGGRCHHPKPERQHHPHRAAGYAGLAQAKEMIF